MIHEAVKKLVTYGMETGLIEKTDAVYTTNVILRPWEFQSMRSRRKLT